MIVTITTSSFLLIAQLSLFKHWQYYAPNLLLIYLGHQIKKDERWSEKIPILAGLDLVNFIQTGLIGFVFFAFLLLYSPLKQIQKKMYFDYIKSLLSIIIFQLTLFVFSCITTQKSLSIKIVLAQMIINCLLSGLLHIITKQKDKKR